MFIYAVLAIVYASLPDLPSILSLISLQSRSDDLGRTFAARERHRRELHRAASRPHVPHPRQPLEEHSAQMALHELCRLDRRRRTDRLGHLALRHRSACVQVRYHVFAAIVSVTKLLLILSSLRNNFSIVSMMSTMVVIWAFVPRIRRVD